MTNSIVMACLPWLIVVAFSLLAIFLLTRVVHARWKPSRIRTLHRCQDGSVQSLSFVLTLPFFLMIVMLIIQVSQIMIASVMVHYAAFASVRSAMVWIPANVDWDEDGNRISSMVLMERTPEGSRYLINSSQDSPKFSRIHQAAVLACAPVSPSRDMGYSLSTNGRLTAAAMNRLYAGLDSESIANEMISARIQNKLAFAYSNTNVQLQFWHRVGPFENFQDPALQVRWDIPPYLGEYFQNELGWQDEISSKVTHNLALLPGPLRLFSASVTVDRQDQTWIYPVTTTATMVNEGEKPVMNYWQEVPR